MANISTGNIPGGGAPGADGADGDFIYVGYASASDGTGFTLTFSASLAYIAIKRSAVEIASPLVGDFAGLWTKYKGDNGTNGTNGTNGADGDNSYTYIAYASADDGSGFTMTYNSALTHIAIKTTTVEIPSPVVGDFTGLFVRYLGTNGADGATGHRAGMVYMFGSSTGAADPTDGKFRLNSATGASVTILRLDDLDNLAVNMEALIQTIVAGDIIEIRSDSTSGTTFLALRATGIPTDATGYWNVPVAYVAGIVPPTNAEICVIQRYGQGNKAGVRYDFSTLATSGDPGPGLFYMSNASSSAVTNLYIDDVAIGSVSAQTFLAAWVKNGLILIQQNGGVNFAIFRINATPTDSGTYFTVPVTYLAGGNFSNTDACVFTYIPSPNVSWDGTDLLDESGVSISTPLAFDTFADAVTATAAAYVGKTAQVRNPGNNVVSATDRRTVRGRPALIFSNPDSGRWECADGEMLLHRGANTAPASGAISFDVTCPAATWIGTYALATANGGLETKITSAGLGAHGLSSANLGAMIEVTAGTNWTPGLYKLTVIEAAGDELTIDHPFNPGGNVLGQPTFTLINGTSAEVLLKRIKIPALSVDGGVRWSATFDCTGTVSKRPRIKYGASGVSVATAIEYFNVQDTAANAIGVYGGFDNRGATNRQIGWHNASSATGVGTTSGSPETSQIESNVATDLLITAHISSAGDMIQLSRSAVWVTL